MIVMCRFMLGKKMVRDVESEGGYACMGAADMWEISVFPLSFVKLILL